MSGTKERAYGECCNPQYSNLSWPPCFPPGVVMIRINNRTNFHRAKPQACASPQNLSPRKPVSSLTRLVLLRSAKDINCHLIPMAALPSTTLVAPFFPPSPADPPSNNSLFNPFVSPRPPTATPDIIPPHHGRAQKERQLLPKQQAPGPQDSPEDPQAHQTCHKLRIGEEGRAASLHRERKLEEAEGS
ncbi:hypothetical protein VaNZ11_014176 [Volvox africanus]|uniref:Uncharacterized protein n=1 Tax=Volvox africanus TaxID=51714 RepID=A0ABQ5SJ75_9CHLO|nr:hypothetical protein VaNZ11_014176 [Volvox africanus]